MKKLIYTLIMGIMLLGCSQQDDLIKQFEMNELNFPSHIEEFGKEIAKNIKQTVGMLNEKGIDYSDANYSQEFRERFCRDWFNTLPVMTKSKESVEQLQLDPIVLYERFNNLTQIQNKFIGRIINEGSKSNSYEEFCVIIKNINKDIHEEVPEIEQERLLYITSALYYGLTEVYILQKQGQMLITPQTNLQFAMIKTRSEAGDDGFWGTCRKIYEATCSFVVGELIETGEIVTTISTEFVVGMGMVFAVVLCFSGDTRVDCDALRDKCIEKGWNHGVKMDCSVCYRYCLNNGHWNYDGCPLN